MTPEEYRKWYTDNAPNYPYLDNFYLGGPHWHRTEFYMKHLTPNSKILDCGCSNGGLAKYITEIIPCEYTAIDIAPFFVSNAKLNAPLCNGYSCSVENIPFKAHYFDYVIAGEILEHVLDLSEALEEILRVLKAGGKLLITTPRPEDSVGGLHVRYLGRSQLLEALPGIVVEENQYSWLSVFIKQFQ